MAYAFEADAAATVEAHTQVRSPPLCPELRLRLLRDDSSLWRGAVHIFDDDGPRPFWAFAWAGGQALARYLLDHPQVVRGRRVLDFGSGSGLVGIAAAGAGAAAVTATDIDPRAVAATKLNAELNGAVVAARCQDILKSDDRDWDVLLAGDAFYLWQANLGLFDWVGPDRQILVGDPVNRGIPRQHCVELAQYHVRTCPEIEHPSITRASVLRPETERGEVPSPESGVRSWLGPVA